MTVAISVGILVAGAVYLMLQRGMVRIILGFVLISHAANLTLMAAGGTYRRGEPLVSSTPVDQAADPLPQAFVLTAIVIAFSITMYMLSLAVVSRRNHTDTDDDTDEGAEAEPRDPDEIVDDTAGSADNGSRQGPHQSDGAGAT